MTVADIEVRYGVDLGIMIGSHRAFRRDLERLARVAAGARGGDPVRAAAVAAGWATFKRQLLNHHEVEDEVVWPRLRERLAGRADALSVLDEMEHEHGCIDPLLAAADAALAGPDAGPALADVVDEMTGKLGGHLTHEERDALPLIGESLTPAEWGQAMAAMMARPGAAEIGAELFPWILEGAAAEQAAALLSGMPPFAAAAYRTQWKPVYDAVARW